MFGITEIQVCSECKEQHEVELGYTDVYEDEKGTFHCTGAKCNCGHILNSERLPNAKKIGIDCF